MKEFLKKQVERALGVFAVLGAVAALWMVTPMGQAQVAAFDRWMRTFNTLADATASNLAKSIYETIYVRGYNSTNDGGGGVFHAVSTVSGTNFGTRIYSGTSGKSWDRVLAAGQMLTPQMFGARGGTNDDTTRIQDLENVVDDSGGPILFPAGSYTLSTLDVSPNVSLLGAGASVVTIKQVNNAQTDLIRIIETNLAPTVKISGITFDGNRAGQNADLTNWWSCVMNYTRGTNGWLEVENCIFTNYVFRGVRSYNSAARVHVHDCIFANGSEHGGVASLDTAAIGYTISDLTNVVGRLEVDHNEIRQDGLPSVYGKAPGGVFAGGNITNNAWVEPVVTFNKVTRMGQDFAGNHIGACADFYEATTNGLAGWNTINQSQYIPLKIQNSAKPRVIGNAIDGVDNGVTGASGGAGILVDINRIALGQWYGGASVIDNRVYMNGPDVEGIKIAGRNTTDGLYRDIVLAANQVTNLTGRALWLVNLSGNIEVAGGIYKGHGLTGSDGAVVVQNAISNATVRIHDTAIEGLNSSHGFFAVSGVQASTIELNNNSMKGSGVGWAATVVAGATNFYLRGNVMDGNGGVSLNAGTAASGTIYLGPDNTLIGSSAITYSNFTASGRWFGSGSPDGVVTADKLCEYQDTGGPYMYLHFASSGNGSWRAVSKFSTSQFSWTGDQWNIREGGILTNIVHVSSAIFPYTTPGMVPVLDAVTNLVASRVSTNQLDQLRDLATASTVQARLAALEGGGGGGGTNTAVYVNGTSVSNPNLTNSATISYAVSASTNVTPSVIDGSIGDAKLRNSAALSVIGRSANSSGVPADIAAANDAEVLRRSGTSIGFGTVATAGIADDAVTAAKMANMAQNTIRGRVTASTGDPEDLTPTQVRGIITVPIFDVVDPGATTIFPAWDDVDNEVDFYAAETFLNMLGAGQLTKTSTNLNLVGNFSGNQVGATQFVGLGTGPLIVGSTNGVTVTNDAVNAAFTVGMPADMLSNVTLRTTLTASNGVGSANQTLVSGGAGNPPQWKTVSGGGDVSGPGTTVTANAAARWSGTTGTAIKEDANTILADTYASFAKALFPNAEVAFGGVLSPAQITANENDYNPTGLTNTSVLRINSDAARNITGVQPMQPGAVLFVHNVGSFDITLKDADAASTAADRFELGADYIIHANEGVIIQYDGTSARWRALARHTFTAAELAAMITGETGTGAPVFGTSPALVTPLIDDYLELNEESAPGTPASGKARLYVKTDGKVYSKDDAGTEYDLTATGSGGVDPLDLDNNLPRYVRMIDDCGEPAGSATASWGVFHLVRGNGGTAPSIDNQAGETNAPGIMRFFSGTAAGTSYIVANNFSSSANAPYNIRGVWTNEVRFRFNATQASGTQEYKGILGLGTSNAGTTPADGVYLQNSITNANFVYMTVSNNVATATSSGLTADTSWHKFRSVTTITAGTPNGSTVFTIDGANSQTVATTVPVGRVVGLQLSMLKTVGATQNSVDIDYIYLGYGLEAAR